MRILLLTITLALATIFVSGQEFWISSSAPVVPDPPPTWPNCGIITDADGNTYNTVIIANQCWMAKNLKVGVRINGADVQTNNGIAEKHCYDDKLANCNIYGGLYEWNEMMNWVTTEGAQGLCPAGWHIPTKADWDELFAFLQPGDGAGTKMRTTGTINEGTGLWRDDPNTQATNSSFFSAVPAGFSSSSNFGNNFLWLGWSATYWASTEAAQLPPPNPPDPAIIYGLNYDMAGYTYGTGAKLIGRSVRCMKDPVN